MTSLRLGKKKTVANSWHLVVSRHLLVLSEPKPWGVVSFQTIRASGLMAVPRPSNTLESIQWHNI